MKAQTLHAHEDRLLDFAYGELPAAEARAMEAHLQGCPKCTEALAEIRGVRATMSRLTEEPAPDAGLESLLAYAQQAARHAAEGPSRAPSWWRRWLVPAVGLASVSFLGIISHQVSKSVDLSPQLSEAVAPEKALKGEVASMAADALPGAPVEVAAPPPPPPAAAPMEEAPRVSEPPRAKVAKRELKQEKSSSRGLREEWSNAGSAGGFPELSDKYKSRDDVGGSSVGAVQAIPPTPAARAELRQAPLASPAPADDERAVPVMEAELQATYAERLPEEPPGAKATPPRSSLRLGEFGKPGAAPPKAGLSAKEAPARKAQAATLSVPELSQRAAKAQRAGDRALEARLLRQALAAGAGGRERVALLIRLCDAEFALGRRDAAIEACGSVLSEAPDSGEAQVARKRLSRDAGEVEPASPPVKD